MARTITVKGVGRATVKPDQVQLHMKLETQHMVYENAMSMASKRIERLERVLAEAGFGEKCLKTTNFNIRTLHRSVKDALGNYKSVFDGYECDHDLKLTFDFDTERLACALRVIAGSGVDPRVDIAFTVKNPAAVNELILQDAAANARKKAQILCDASGTRLGELMSIDYNWGEISYVSPMQYCMDDRVLACTEKCSINIEPEDIDAGDTVTFIWQLQ